MSHRPPVRRVAAAAALALASSILLAPSPAHAVITAGILDSNVDLHADGAACTVSDGGSDVQDPLTDNSTAARTLALTNATVTADGDPTDITTVSATVTSKASTSVSAGVLTAAEFVTSGSVQVDADLGLAQTCVAHGTGSAYMEFNFTVAQDSWMVVRQANRGGGYNEVLIERNEPPDNPYFDAYTEGLKVDNNATIFIPAGEYAFYSQGSYDLAAPDAAGEPTARTGSTAVKVALQIAGTRTTGLVGKAKKYLTTPASVSCGTNSLASKLKGNAKKLKTARFFVNGKVVKTVRNPGKNATVTLGSLDSEEATNLKILVKTKKVVKKKIRKGEKIREVIKPKKFTATQSYLSCR